MDPLVSIIISEITSIPRDNAESLIEENGKMDTLNMKCYRFDYEWKIKDFVQRIEHPMVPIDSPEFSIPSDINSRFFIRMCRNEKLADSIECITLGLCFLELCKARVRVNFKLPDPYALSGIPSRNINVPRYRSMKPPTTVTPTCFNKQDFAIDMIRDLTDNNLLIRFEVIIDDSFSKKIIEQPECTLSDDLNTIFGDEKFSDVTIIVGKAEFHAHKAILTARSPVFKCMFQHGMIENEQHKVVISDINEEVMQEVLRFIYSGVANNVRKNCFELLAAADKYQLERLKWMCEKEVFSTLSIENASKILMISDMYDAPRLKGQTIFFIEEHAEQIMDSKGWESILNTMPHLVSQVCRAIATKKYIPERKM